MSNTEKYIKSKLENHKINSEGQEDLELWNAIQEGLEVPVKKDRRRLILFLFIVIFLIGAFGFYKTTGTQDEIRNESQGIAELKRDQTNTQKEKMLTQISDTDTKMKEAIQSDHRSEILTTNEVVNSVRNTIPSANSMKPNQSITKSASVYSKDLLDLADLITTPTLVNEVNVVAKKEPIVYYKNKQSRIVSRDDKGQSKDYSLLAVKTLNSLIDIERRGNIEIDYNVDLLEATSKTKSNGFEVTLYCGPNLLLLNYSSIDDVDFGEVLSDLQGSSYGRSVGMNTSFDIGDRFTFNGGIESQEVYIELNTQEFTFETRTAENALIKAWIDSFDGSTINEEYGDITVVDTIVRSVINHNKFNRFSIPLSVGLKKQLGKVEFDLSLGLSLNKTIRQEGFQFLQDSKLYETNKNSYFTVGWYIEPNLSIDLMEGYFISINPRYTYGNAMNYSSELFKQNAFLLNLNIGIGYRFR